MRTSPNFAMTSMIKWVAFVLTFATNAAMAHATVLVPTDDTSVLENLATPSGHHSYLAPKLMRNTTTNASYTGSVAVIRFKVKQTDIAKDVKLQLDVSAFTEALTCGFHLWGLADSAGSKQSITEEAAAWSSYSGLLNTSEIGVNTSSSSIFDGDTTTTAKDPLATITLTQADLGKTVTFSSAALVNFINADDDGDVTFFITRTLRSNSFDTQFASRENVNYSPPRLIIDANTILHAADDTYGRYGDATVYGAETTMPVKNCGEECANSRRGVMRFNVPAGIDVEKATLTFDVANYSQNVGTAPNAASFLVYGVREGSSTESFNQSTANDATFSHELDGSGVGVVNSHVDFLGKFWVKNTDVGKTVAFTSDALVDFISTDTNGKVAFIVARTQNTPYLNVAFATKEHTTLAGPTLHLTQAVGDVAMPTMKFVFEDIDGDSDNETMLVVELPGGDGYIVVDPFTIAETLRIAGHDFGSGTDFWDMLSVSQQAVLLETVTDIVGNVGTTVDASELNAARTNLPEGRTYQVQTFKGDFQAATESGIGGTISASALSASASYALGYSSVEVGSGSAGAMFTSSGLAFGAEFNAIVITTGVGDPAGSTASINFSSGVGFYTQMKYGQDGQYGLSVPLVVAPIGVSLYVKGSDAVTAWNHVKFWSLSWGMPLYQVSRNITLLGIDWGNDVRMVSLNAINESAAVITHSGDVAIVWTKDAGRESTVWLYGTTNTVRDKLNDACSAINTELKDVSLDAADELSDWSTTAGSSVVASYDTSAGWVEGSASTVGNLAEDIADGTVEVAEDVGDAVMCNALWCF